MFLDQRMRIKKITRKGDKLLSEKLWKKQGWET
jgi:hypothetical protein